MKFLKILFICIGLLITAVACGSGGSSSNGNSNDVGNDLDNESGNESSHNANLNHGVFLDSAVEGLQYMSGNQSGITDANGTFSYEDKKGATVKFFIGDIEIGEAGTMPILTPINLFSTGTDLTDATVTNISRFLQTIDNDNDPVNGITINEAVRKNAGGMSLNFNQDISSFESDDNMQAVIADLTAFTDAGQRTLVPSRDAQAHLHNTIMSNYSGTYSGTFSGDYSGTWSITIYSSGTVVGSGKTDSDNSSFDMWGSISNKGIIFINTEGSFSNAHFSGSIQLFNHAFGEWNMNDNGSSGKFSGTKTGEIPAAPKLNIFGYYEGLIYEVSGCSGITVTLHKSNIQYDSVRRMTGFDNEITFEDGHCKGRTYFVSVHDITYSGSSYMSSAKYEFEGKTYDVRFFRTPIWP